MNNEPICFNPVLSVIPSWLAQSAAYMAVVFDDTGHMLEWNQLFAATCSKHAIQQRAIQALLSVPAYARLLAWKKNPEAAIPLHLADTFSGLSLSWEITPLDGGKPRFMALIRQLQLSAHQPLRIDSEYLFHVFVNNSPISSWITDSEGRFMLMNKGFKAFSQLTDADAGKTLWQIFPAHLADAYHANNQKVLELNKVMKIEESAPDVHGVQHDFIVYKFPLIGSDGRQMVGGCSIDITERRKAEQRLYETTTRLREITFFQSHQLRKPLTNMIAIFNLLKESPEGMEENFHQQMMDALNVCVQEMDQLSREIVIRAGDK